MTIEEWNLVEQKLESLYNTVRLKCDEYEISIMLIRRNQFKNVLVVYVNGVIKGEWLMKECEEAKRFFKKVTKSVLSSKEKKAFLKLPKKLQKELGMDKTYSYFLADWTSFKALKKQLIERNKSVELIHLE